MPTADILHNKPFFLLFVFLFLFPSEGLAHKIRVFAWVSDNMVTVESGFAGNRPLIKGKVTVKDNKTGTVLLQGVGDAKGIFTFPIPDTAKAKATDLLIVVSGGEGHQNHWLIPAAEYLPDQEAPPAAVDPSGVAPSPSLPLAVPPAAPAGITNAELKKIVEEALAEQLAPIKRSLAKAEERKRTISDILGGIGYLLGLAGLAAWFRNRRPGKRRD